MIEATEDLVTSSVNKLGKRDQTKLGVLAFVNETLRLGVGSLLLPLFSGLRTLQLTIQDSCRLLPSLYRLLASIDDLGSRMPEVIAKEKAFTKGESQRVVVTRTGTVESNHPLTQGNHNKTLSIPGVAEMLLDFDPKTFKSMQQGSTLVIYKDAGFTMPLHTLTAAPAAPIKIVGDTVYISYSCGYNRDWGFKASGKAFIEEESMDLPWLLDLGKSIALFAGKCAGMAVRGEDEEKEEKASSKWLENELLSEGMDYPDDVSAAERKEIAWIPDALDETTRLERGSLGLGGLGASGSDDAYAAAGSMATSMPKLIRTQSYQGVSLSRLVQQFADRMIKGGVRAQKFPVPKEATEVIDKAMYAVIGVLIKHNKLVTETQTFVNSPADTKPSESLSAS